GIKESSASLRISLKNVIQQKDEVFSLVGREFTLGEGSENTVSFDDCEVGNGKLFIREVKMRNEEGRRAIVAGTFSLDFSGSGCKYDQVTYGRFDLLMDIK
ncbi:MAG: hypothetical protein AAGI07_07925, partial [Bacteroidota bacterium]